MKVEITFDTDSGRLRVKMQKTHQFGYVLGPYSLEPVANTGGQGRWWLARGPGIKHGECNTMEDGLEQIAGEIVAGLHIFGGPWPTEEV